MNKPAQLTSVKVDSELLESFKMLSIKTKCDFRTLVNASLSLYINDENFRTRIHNS